VNSIFFRRNSGIYFARLVVPAALRGVVGKRELIASTGSRDLALAKVVAGVILSGWCQHLLRLQGVAPASRSPGEGVGHFTCAERQLRRQSTQECPASSGCEKDHDQG
jgi:hypothetical protein